MKNYRVETEREIIKNTGVEFFYHNRTNSKVSVIPHLHSAVEILFVKKGKFKIFANDIQYNLGEGCVFLIRSNTAHVIETVSDGDAGYYVFKFSPRFLSELSSPACSGVYLLTLTASWDKGKTLWTKNESKELFLALEKLISESKYQGIGGDIGIRLAAGEIILKLIRELKKYEAEPPKIEISNDTVWRIYEATLYIDEHYAEPIRADKCAKEACMSYSYFSRCFSQITGKSFKEYLNSVRINRAERALFSTDKPITEIALDNGFNDVSYFISVYKALKGIPPNTARLIKRKIENS